MLILCWSVLVKPGLGWFWFDLNAILKRAIPFFSFSLLYRWRTTKASWKCDKELRLYGTVLGALGWTEELQISIFWLLWCLHEEIWGWCRPPPSVPILGRCSWPKSWHQVRNEAYFGTVPVDTSTGKVWPVGMWTETWSLTFTKPSFKVYGGRELIHLYYWATLFDF